MIVKTLLDNSGTSKTQEYIVSNDSEKEVFNLSENDSHSFQNKYS